MPAVSRIGDMSTIDPSPCSAPPRPLIEGSPNVFVNSIPVSRLSDAYEEHYCVNAPEPHTATAIQGSATVFVNGLAIHRITDAISCGSVSNQGSPNVFADDVGHTPIILSKEFTGEAVVEILKISRYAMLDDPSTVDLTPKSIPADTGQPEVAPQTEDSDKEPEETPPSPNCEDMNQPDYSLQLSPHFNLGSLSNRALFKHNIKAQAGLMVPDIVCNLKGLANNVLEKIVAKYPGARINSGFRTMTNGKSQHEKGQACDIQWPGISNQEYLARAKWIVDNIVFDQLIFEHGNSIWIHVSYNRTASSQRRKTMTMKSGKYEQGLKLYYA